ncbi:MAG: hypothetical protein GX684_05380 [Ruminococcaceae bacterium]|nr:hypothetical protein [Oscillospiraceae bacterium]
MKVAVPIDENELISSPLSEARRFCFFEVNGEEVINEGMLISEGTGNDVKTLFLVENGTDVLICSEIEDSDAETLALCGIHVYPGLKGLAEAAVTALSQTNLTYDPYVPCDDNHQHTYSVDYTGLEEESSSCSCDCGGHEHTHTGHEHAHDCDSCTEDCDSCTAHSAGGSCSCGCGE